MLGITKLIRKTFAPHFKFKNLQKVPRNVGGLKKKAACRRGKLLDRQLSDFALNGAKASFCKETKLVIEKLEELNLEISKTQHYVSNSELKMCTFIDLVAFKKDSHMPVIIEVKRGCHYKHCSTLNGVLRFHDSTVNDSLLHQHQLQALLGKLLYEKQNPEVSCDCYLLYVDENTCEHIQQNSFNVQICAEALNAIKNVKITKKRKR